MIVALSAGRDSPAELRSRVALDEDAQRRLLGERHAGVAELVVLSTCHRTEVYATGDGAEADLVHAVAALLPSLLPTDQHDVRYMQGSEAIEHLFRVACGLDSLVIGEPQVLGQVRSAYALATQTRSAGPVLSNIFNRAIRLGKSVRSQTAIGRLGQSIGTIAADYLSDRFEGLTGKIGTVVGAGEAATDAARALSRAGATLTVVSRSEESAARLGDLLSAPTGRLQDLGLVLDRSHFAVVAVSGGLLMRPEVMPRRDPSDPFVILDLSVPKAVDMNGRGDIEVRTLEEIPGPRGPEVTDAVIDAESMVKREIADLERWADTRYSGPAIRDLRSFAETIVRDEVLKTVQGMQLSVEDQERIEILGMRIANKLLHSPTVAMRRSDEIAETVRKLFGLET